MKLLTSTTEIQDGLRLLRPTHIAVAYIGLDWQQFIEPQNIEQIVLSPTVGSNPYAIEVLVKEIGWERISFWDTLHAKLYLGRNALILGSANLTRNALDIGGLQEICIYSEDSQLLTVARKVFDKYTVDAFNLYPSITAKMFQLEKLRKEFNRGIEYRILKGQKSNTTLLDYNPQINQSCYICWYQPGDFNYNYEILRRSLPHLNNDEIDNAIIDQMLFSPLDSIESQKWILCWIVTNDYQLDKRSKLRWVYIHEIYPDACDDKGYESIAAQLKERETPDPPFVIENDENLKSAFAKVIESGEFKEFYEEPDDGSWLVKNTFDKFPEFILRWKKEYTDLKKRE